MSNKLNAMDLAFLSLEKRNTPINVASLTILEVPKHYKGNFTRNLLNELLKQAPVPPFNQKLSSVHSASLPHWVTDTHFDIHYHVRHSALPHPGSMDDLLALTSRLHSQLLDRTRPLWEFHLIEGLENNQFAMYLKMHHAAIDGMGGIELMKNWFCLSNDTYAKAPWACMPMNKSKRATKHGGIMGPYTKFIEQTLHNTVMVQDLSKMVFHQYLKAIGFDHNASPVPFSAPHSILNVPITGSRSFVVKSLPLAQIDTLSKQADATINDIVLAICSGALRKYLMEKGKLPLKSLIASVPIAVNKKAHSGNQISYVVADLATNEPDTMSRLAKIGHSTRDAKGELTDVSPSAATNFAFLAQGVVAMLNQLNISSMMPPAANVVISNVPGPRESLFFGQAKLKATYPLSVLVDGQALNITVISYGETIGVGLMACRDVIPDVEVIADYIESAVEDIKAGIYLRDLMLEQNSDK